MEQTNSEILYEGLKQNPKIKGLPETFEEFNSLVLSNPSNKKILYEGLISNPAIDGLPKTYEEFDRIIKPKSIQPKDDSFLDTFGKIVDVIATPIDIWMKPLAELIVDKTAKPEKIDINKAKEDSKDISVSKPSITDEEYSDKLFNSVKNSIRSQSGAQEEVVDYQSIEFLKKLGLEPTTKKNKKGEEYISFNDVNKQFTEQEKQSLYKEADNIALTYNKRIKELQDLKSEVQFYYQGVGKFLPTIDQLKTEEQVNLEKSYDESIEKLEEEKNLLISTIKYAIGTTKPEARKVNPETGIIATQPLEKIDFQNIDKIDPNEIYQTMGLANYDLEERNKGIKSANSPTNSVDSLGKSLLFMDYVDKGLELIYGANPEMMKRKKSLLADAPFKDDQKPAIEQQEAAFVAIKQEQKALASSIEQNEQSKLYIDEQLDKLSTAYKKGEKLTPEQEAAFNNLSILSTLLDKNIKLQKDNIKELQSFIDNTTSAYIGFLAEQYKYDRIASAAPITVSIYDGLESLALIPERIGKYGLRVGEISGLVPSDVVEYANLKTSPEFRYEVNGELKPIKDIEPIKLMDENGKFNFDVHVPSLLYNTVRVSGESFTLGLGMLGTRALVASTIEKNLAKWAAGEAASEIGISQVLPTNPLSVPFRQLGREFTKAAIMGTGSEAAFLSPLYIAESTIGSAVPSALLFGDEMIQNQLDQNLPYKAAFFTGTLLSFIEGYSERMFPNEMNFAKSLIQKGEIKTLKELTENSTYKKAIQETYKQITGKPLTETLYKALTSTKEFTKSFASTGGEEILEELGGLFAQDKFVNPISRKYNPDYKGEEFTKEAIVNTSISTMATMLPMMGQAGYSGVKQYNTAQKLAQFIVGQNPTPYHEMNSILFKEGVISEQEFQRRTQLIDKHKENYNNALSQAITKSFTSNYTEDQFKNYAFEIFSKLSSIEQLKKAVVENPNDEGVFQILERENQDLQVLLEKGLFKTEEERISNVKNSLSFYLSPDNVKTFNEKEAKSTVDKLKQYYLAEKDEDVKSLYDSKIQLLNQRVAEIEKQKQEEQKTKSQKAKESENKGVVSIPTAKGEKNYQIGKKYIVGRQILFDQDQPIRFPEVTFLGYKKDENGEIVKQNDVPVVIFETKNLKGQKIVAERPISSFQNYNLGTEESLNSTPSGRYYNKYKNKKFTLSLSNPKKEGKNVTGNKFFNKLRKYYDVSPEDVLEGVLSIESENGKPVLYFNFKAKNKKGDVKEGYVELTDSDIKTFEKYKQPFLKPKTKTYTSKAGNVVSFQGQYENMTFEDFEDLVGFTEEEQRQYEEYLKSEDFEDLKRRRLLQEGRRRDIIQQYINEISAPLTKVLQEIENLTTRSKEYADFLETSNTIKSLLNIARFSQITDEQIKKLLPATTYKKYNKIESNYEKINFLNDYINNKVDAVYKKATSISNKLSNLEAKKEKYQEYIDDQLQFLETIDVSELDYTTSITKQLRDKRKALKDLLNQKEESFNAARSVIDNLLEAIEKAKEVINELFETIKSTSKLFNKYNILAKLNQQLTEAQSNLIKIQSEKQEISSQIKNLTKLINYLSKIEESIEKQMRDLDSQRLKELIIEENKKQTPTQTETNTTEEDRELEDKSAKKDLLTLFASSTSWGYDYEKGLKNPTNNYANARLDYFLNNQKTTGDILLLPITKNNAAKYGLEGILTEGKEENDIQLVPIKIGAGNTFIFLDMEGKAIDKPSPENVIYTPLPLIDKLSDLRDTQGKLKYNLSSFKDLSEEQLDKMIASYVEQFRKFRESILSAENPKPLTNINISKGIPQYSGKQNEIYVRNPVRGTLLPETYTNFTGTIIVATQPSSEGSKTGTLNDYNGTPVTVPLGRPILFKESTKTFQSLDNHKLTENQKETVKKVIYTLALKARENFEKVSKNPDSSQSILDLDLINYLKGVVYWRNPNRLVNNKTQSSPSRNQMWVDYNEKNELALFYGNNGVNISFKNLIESEGKHEALDIIADYLFHNINVDNFKKSFREYYVENGELKSRIWDSYENYLLSDKFPNKTPRNNNEIPLTTNIIKNSSPFNEDGTFNENYNPQYQSKYFTFKSPIKNVDIKEEEEKKEQKPPKENKQPSNVQAVEDYLESLINNPEIDEPIKQKYREVIATWKSLIKDFKPGAYSIRSKNPSVNEGEPFVFFNVDDKATVSNFKTNIYESLQKVLDKTELKINSESIQGIFDLFTAKKQSLTENEKNLLLISYSVQPVEKNKSDDLANVTFSSEEELQEAFEEPTNKPKKEIVKKGRPNNQGYRLAVGNAERKINIQKAKEWLNKTLPQLEIKVVSGLIDGIAWGKFMENSIILSEAAEIGTEYHEAFEAVAALFLTKREWNTIKYDFKNRKGSYVDRETGNTIQYSEATDHQIKEQIAEEYRDYVLSNGKIKWEGEYKKNNLFRRIWNHIKFFLFGDARDVNEVFERISSAYYKDKSPVKWNRPFNLEKSYRIANLQDDLFFKHLNESLNYLLFKKVFKDEKNLSGVFKGNKSYFNRIYSEIKNDLLSYYLGYETSSGKVVNLIKHFGYESLDDLLDNYDEFFDKIVDNYRDDVTTLSFINVVESNLTIDAIANKYKDQLISAQYIMSNWEEIINQHAKKLAKFKISYEGELEDVNSNEDVEESEYATQEELQNSVGRDEYTKDPFSVFLKDSTNNRVKFLLATLPQADLTGEIDSNGLPTIQVRYNALGLEEPANFSKTFRKVVTTVINDSNIEEMLESIKKAIPNNPEFKNLYIRLGGLTPVEQLSKETFELRNAFAQSLNKQRIEFSRVLLRVVEKGRGKNKTYNLVSNLINSLKSSGSNAIVNRYIENLKLQAFLNGWIDEESQNIIIPKDGIPSDNKNLQANVQFLESIGFNFPYNIENLSPKELILINEPINNILNFIRSNEAKLEQLRYFNFSKHVKQLAEAELEITKDANETQHRNIDNQPQSNDISINAFSQVWKGLNKSTDISQFISLFPRFNDIYTQNAYWRELYFTNGERNNVKYSVESAEGVVDENNKGKHSSKLPLNMRFLQEFIYNIYNDKKGFRTPGFYIITPADIKTEFVNKWGRELVNRTITQSTEDFFDLIAKGYLIDEINLTRELSIDDRGLAAYNRKNEDTEFVKNRTYKNSLRFFHDILKFDYTDVIDNNQINPEEWIEFNKKAIVDSLDDFLNKGVDEVFDKFLDEQIISEVNLNDKTYFDFFGIDDYLMNWIDGEFGTNLVSLNKKYNKNLFTESQLKDLIRYRNVNYFVNIVEQSKLFLGDFAQYKDLTKRVKSFVSTRESTIVDNPLSNNNIFTNLAKKFYNKVTFTNELGEVIELELEPNTPGYQEFTNEFKSSTIKDVEVIQTSIDNITSKHKESLSSDLFFSEFSTLPEKVQKFINEKVAKVLKPFSEVNEADGQAYMALPLYRQFLLRSTMWSDEKEELYQYHMAYERSKRNKYPNTPYGNKLKEIDELIVEKGNPNIERAKKGLDPIDFPVLKPIGAGVRPGNKFIATLDKNSVAPLFYQALEGKPSLDTYLSAIDNGNQYFRFESAHKVGTPKTIVSPYSYNGKSVIIPITDELSFSDFGIQVETRTSKTSVTRGTQSLKIPLLNLFEASVPIDFIKSIRPNFVTQIEELKSKLEDFNPSKYMEEWFNLNNSIISFAKQQWQNLTEAEKSDISPIYKAVKQHNDVITSLTNRYFDQISNEFSLEKQNDVIKIKDFSKFKEALHRQLKDRDAANNLIAQIEVENGKMVQPFDFIIGADKLEPILYSILNKNVVQPKINGRALAQIASTFFENSPRKYVKKVKTEDGFRYEEVENPETYPNKEELILTSNDLLFYGDYYVELPNGDTRKATQEEIDKGIAKEANFIEIYLPQIFKDRLNNFITDKGKIDSQLLKAVGFRIPTQELSSMENIRIKGFLPLEYQNGVVVPSSITAKVGSDFDIDKLNIYLYHYTYSAKQNKVIKIPYLDDSNSTPEQRYVNYIKDNLQSYKEKLTDDEVSEQLKEELWKNLGKIWTKTIREIFKNLPEFTETKPQFNLVKESIQNLKNKKLVKDLLDILYSKESNLDKYETITEILSIEAERQLFDEAKVISELQKEIDLLFDLNEIQSKTLKNLKSSMKNTLGYASLKGQMRETEDEVIANYIFQYNIQVPDIHSYEKFLTLLIDEQNTTKALENRYIDSIQSILSLPENFTRLMNPNSTDALKSLVKKLDELKKVEKESKKISDFLSPIKNVLTRYSFQIGKEGVGIGAVGMTNEAINQLVDTYIKDSSIYEISLILPTNEAISFRRDRNGEFISNNISEFINAFVDIAKDPFIIRLNGTLSTAGSYLVANKIGIPLENMAFFMNQPIILDYERLLEFIKSPLGRVRAKSSGKGGTFTYLNNQIKNKYGQLKDDYKPSILSIDEFSEMITSEQLTEEQKQHQLYILNTYLKIKNISDDLRNAVSTYNYDTDQPKFITDVLSKLGREQNYLKNDPSIIIPTKDTFFNTIKEKTINYTSALMPLFQSFSSSYYPYIKTIQDRISYINDENQRQKALAEIKKGLANFLLLTYNNSQLQSQLPSILMTDELTKEIKQLKKDMEEGKIEENFAISELFPLPADKINKKTFNLTLFNKENTGEYIDLIANSLKQLESNPKYSLIAKKIYALALLQSGLTTSFISLSQFIPHETFTKLAKEVVANPNLSLLPNFEQMFYANKWKDGKFTLASPKWVEYVENISKSPIIKLSAAYFDETGKIQINYKNLANFQLASYSLIESEELSKKWKTRIFQRVEDKEGNPILLQSPNGYDFIYREVTPLGDGQNALEYSLKSKINENVDEDSKEQIIANLQSNFPDATTTLKDLQQSILNNKTNSLSSSPEMSPAQQQELGNREVKPASEQLKFEEEQTTGYRNRTIKNASADATIALATDFTSAGEILTKNSVLNQKKKYISIDANNLEITKERVDKIVDALNSVNAKTLNIAGNGIYTMKGKYTQEQVDEFTYQLLKAVIESPNLKTKIESIRTGGQTGFDEAGAKAGIRLGIPTLILAPKGWKFRDITGKDISDEKQFKDRFKELSQPTSIQEEKDNIIEKLGEDPLKCDY